MIRINLIPPEIVQKRKDEQRWQWIAVGGVVLAVVIALVYAVMFFQVVGQQSEVASIRQQAASLQAETSRFQIFQQKQSELQTVQAAITAASKDRVDWAQMLDDIGLVLPTDSFLTAFNGTEGSSGTPGNITMSGNAVDHPDDPSESGYRSVAKALVRFADLAELDSVWLTDAQVQSTSSNVTTTTTAPYIAFDLTAKISPQASLAPVTLVPSGN